MMLEALPNLDVVLLGQDRFVQLGRLLFPEAFYLNERLAQSHTSQKCLDEERPRGQKKLQSTRNFVNHAAHANPNHPQPLQKLRL